MIKKEVQITKPVNKETHVSPGTIKPVQENIQETDFVSNLLFNTVPYETLIQSLGADVPITDLSIQGNPAIRLQEYLIDIRSYEEYNVMRPSMNTAGLVLFVPFDTPPRTGRIREELEEVLAGKPELLKRYDTYTFNNPRLWKTFIEAAWYAKKFSESDSFKRDKLSPHLQDVLTSEFKETPEMPLFKQWYSSVKNGESLHDALPKGIMAHFDPEVRRIKQYREKILKTDAKTLVRVISEMGHDYRALQARNHE